jgi:predicted outer membrane repeat protein
VSIFARDCQLLNVTLMYNSARGSGGAVEITQRAQVHARNCHVQSNSATGKGGAIVVYDSSLELCSSTVAYVL